MGISCRSVLCCELKISSSDWKTTTKVYMYSLYEGRLKRSLATLATRNRDHICHSSSVPQPQNSRRSPQAGVFRCPWPGIQIVREMECGATTLRKKKPGMPCSLCSLTFSPGTVWVPKFTDYHTPGQPDPEARDYFCADCFRSSRPFESCCRCTGSQHWFREHKAWKEEIARHAEARRPPGPPPGSPPSTALAIPSPSSAASVSASSGGDINIDRPENLVHVVERLQQEMRDMKEQMQEIREMKQQIEQLENVVRCVWNARAASRMQ